MVSACDITNFLYLELSRASCFSMESLFSNKFLLFCFVWYVLYSKALAAETHREQKFVKVSQDGLALVYPFKITTAASSAFCSFDCTEYCLCLSFVFLKQKTSENCLLSTDPEGGRSQEDSETFKSIWSPPSSYEEVCVHNKCQRGSKCVACSSEHYGCGCFPWSTGFHCENLNPAYNHTLMPWKQGHGGGLTYVDSWYHTWATNVNDYVYILQNGLWVMLNGRLDQVSIGEPGVWGKTSDAGIYYRKGITDVNVKGTVWYHDTSGLLNQISSGLDIVWGLAGHDIYYNSANSWNFIHSGFKWVSCGKYGCWAVRIDGSANFRTGVTANNAAGVAWVDTGGSFKCLDTGVRGEVYAVDDEGQVYTREGISEDKPQGEKWSRFGKKLLNYVSPGDKIVYGIAMNGEFYTLP